MEELPPSFAAAVVRRGKEDRVLHGEDRLAAGAVACAEEDHDAYPEAVVHRDGEIAAVDAAAVVAAGIAATGIVAIATVGVAG